MNQVEAETAQISSISEKVVRRVAEVDDVDPIELTPPLCEVIDPDALESLFTSNRALGKVVFNYNGNEVSVFSDGHVSIKSHGT